MDDAADGREKDLEFYYCSAFLPEIVIPATRLVGPPVRDNNWFSDLVLPWAQSHPYVYGAAVTGGLRHPDTIIVLVVDPSPARVAAIRAECERQFPDILVDIMVMMLHKPERPDVRCASVYCPHPTGVKTRFCSTIGFVDDAGWGVTTAHTFRGLRGDRIVFADRDCNRMLGTSRARHRKETVKHDVAVIKLADDVPRPDPTSDSRWIRGELSLGPTVAMDDIYCTMVKGTPVELSVSRHPGRQRFSVLANKTITLPCVRASDGLRQVPLLWTGNFKFGRWPFRRSLKRQVVLLTEGDVFDVGDCGSSLWTHTWRGNNIVIGWYTRTSLNPYQSTTHCEPCADCGGGDGAYYFNFFQDAAASAFAFLPSKNGFFPSPTGCIYVG